MLKFTLGEQRSIYAYHVHVVPSFRETDKKEEGLATIVMAKSGVERVYRAQVRIPDRSLFHVFVGPDFVRSHTPDLFIFFIPLFFVSLQVLLR